MVVPETLSATVVHRPEACVRCSQVLEPEAFIAHTGLYVLDVESTAGAGLNIAPNGARLCRWLGVDLDGGDPKGPHGAIDGGRASILESTRQVMPDNTLSTRPIDHDTSARDGAGFHHMHRLDLLMCLYKRVGELIYSSVSVLRQSTAISMAVHCR